jgi:hypothetical protein
MDSTDTTTKPRTLSMTRDAVRKRLKRDNERFKALAPAAKRVAIAQDVLKWLNIGKLRATSGQYLRSGELNDMRTELQEKYTSRVNQRANEDNDAFDNRWYAAQQKYRAAVAKIDAQDLLVKDDVSCSVCALGGIFACAVARLDELNVDEFLGVTRRGMHEYLGEFFSSRQLDLIETAFEAERFGSCKHGDPETGETIDEDEDEAALAFCDDINFATGVEDDEGNEILNRDYAADRMRRIMENIIANGGEFRP